MVAWYANNSLFSWRYPSAFFSSHRPTNGNGFYHGEPSPRHQPLLPHLHIDFGIRQPWPRFFFSGTARWLLWLGCFVLVASADAGGGQEEQIAPRVVFDAD